VLAAGVLAFVPGAAYAGGVNAFTRSFGGKGSAAGLLEPTSQSGVAVNDVTHDVYVADTGNHRVDEFGAEGAFIVAFGREVGPLGEDICTTLSTCKAGASGSEPGEFEAPTYVAVDNSPGGEGDVYVADTGTTLVQKFTAEGALVKSWGDEGQLGRTPITVAEGTGKITAGSREITELKTSKGNFAPFEQITGEGISSGTETEFIKQSRPQDFIENLEEGRLGISSNATATKTGVALTVQFSLKNLKGIAIDTTGHLWIASESVVVQCEQNGICNNQLYTEREIRPDGAAVDSTGDVYFADAQNPEEVVKYMLGSVQLPGGASGPVTGFAVDQTDNELYIDRGPSVQTVGPSGGVGETFSSPELSGGGGAGVAVDSYSGAVYVANAVTDRVEDYGIILEANTSSVSTITPTTATLRGEVNPEGTPVSECRFEYATSTAYEQSVPCEQTSGQIGSGASPVEVRAKITGLLGGTTYHFRLVADREDAVTHKTQTAFGSDEEFFTLPVPVVANGEAANLTLSGAELRATVNPEGLQVTHCAFEYGTTPAYGASVRCAQKKAEIGAGTEPVPVSAQLSELEPNTTYYWRLSVGDEPVKGEPREAFEPGHTFVYSTATAELPDYRAYEMVSPVQKNGGLIGDTFAGFGPQLSADGSRVIALDIQCFAPAESCNAARQTIGEPVEMTRTDEAQQCVPAAPPCWAASALAPPTSRFSQNSPWAASANAGTALFSMPTGPAGEDEWYARSAGGSFTAIGPAASPRFTGVDSFGLTNKDATADLSHLVWELKTTQGSRWPFDKATEGNALYEYARAGNEEPFLVGVTGESGSTELIGTCGIVLGAGSNGVQLNPMSADGRTVYFTAETGRKKDCPGGTGTNAGKEIVVRELYARVDGEEPGSAHTVALSEPQALAPASHEECQSASCKENTSIANEIGDWRSAEFEGASEDGSTAFFTSEQQLTDGATQGSQNLYESLCTQSCGAAEEQRRLIDVSEPSGGVKDPGGPGVQGVMAISGDGSHVYFVANGVLASGARPGDCTPAGATGRCNLYVYERDARYPEGHVAFIASLPASDREATGSVSEWGEGPVLANVTPDGRFLVFESRGDLTSDTHAGGSAQVFRYDAESEQLARVSVGEGGLDDDGNAGTGEATIVAPAAVSAGQGPSRVDPTMSDDGAYVFFQSPRALTSHALDDARIATGLTGTGHVAVYAQNVYEWHEGHVYLISDAHDASTASTPCGGTSPNVKTRSEIFESAVCLLGADATGQNVFFMTADRLVPKDTDTQVDIYDARICEPEAGNPCISEPPPLLPPCGGEACHGIPATTPSLLAPGTATFNGEGNATPSSPVPAVVKKKVVKCHKGFVKNGKGRCVKSKRKHTKAKKSVKVDRRAK
jgi:DNA-binding beta-propeller fold protein YncE